MLSKHGPIEDKSDYAYARSQNMETYTKKAKHDLDDEKKVLILSSSNNLKAFWVYQLAGFFGTR